MPIERGAARVREEIAVRSIVAALLLTTTWAAAAEPVTVPVVYLALAPQHTQPKTLLDPVPTDKGLQGARLGLADDQTTGAFTGQHFVLQESVLPDADAAVAAAKTLAGGRQPRVRDRPSGRGVAAGRGPARGQGRRAAGRHQRRRQPARPGLPPQRAASAAQPGHAGRRADAIPGGQALARPAARHRPDRRRPQARRRLPPQRAQVPAPHRRRQALDLQAGRATHRHGSCLDCRRGRAVHPGRLLRHAGGRRHATTISATTSRFAPSTRARSPARRAWCPPPGRIISSNGERPSSSCAFRSRPTAG